MMGYHGLEQYSASSSVRLLGLCWVLWRIFGGSLDFEPSSFLLRKVRYVVGPKHPTVGKMLVGSVIEWWEDVIAWARQRCSLVVGWLNDSKDAQDPCTTVDYDCRSAYSRLRPVAIGRVFAPFCTDVPGPCNSMPLHGSVCLLLRRFWK